jgi:NAD(P)-dependent dehydrogenase (short-subunit alcohol dehydrogenase family)
MVTPQQPIRSGYSAKSTASEIATEITKDHNLKGKIAIVTGGNSGIGLETVKTLAAAGAQVIVGARDTAKAHKALDNNTTISFEHLDLADPASVDAFAAAFNKNYNTLHYLINNAGIFRPPQLEKDLRGFELQFGTHHLGHFQLTGRLLEALKAAGKSRVISLSSVGHRRMGVQLDDLNFEKQPYDSAKAYAQSKTATSLFTVHLDAIGQPHDIRAFAVHPGAIITDIFRLMTKEQQEAWMTQASTTLKEGFKTPQQGAATTIWCALSPQLNNKGGVYCEDCDIAQLVPNDSPATTGVRAFAVDPATAKALWQKSEAITGIAFAL